MANARVADDATKSAQGVDAGSMLLRLAGKPSRKGEGESKDKVKCKQKTKESRRNSDRTTLISSPLNSKFDKENTNNDKPDLAAGEVDESRLSTFRDLFNMLDQSNTGIITVDNLYEELRNVDSEITFYEVEDLLRRVDKDGDGQIDFNEFLFHMTTMEGDLFGELGEDGADEERKKSFSRRKRLFNAITQFSIKQTLADIEKTFHSQAPHVISHYTAGVRLIGLTTRQLERQMKKMQKSAAKNDSPYAKPLQFVHVGSKGNNKYVERKEIQTTDRPGSSRELHSKDPSLENQADSVKCLSQEIHDTMKLFAQKRGNDNFVQHDANIIRELSKKIGTVTAKFRGNVPETLENEQASAYTLEVPKSKHSSGGETKMVEKKCTGNEHVDGGCQSGENRTSLSGLGWTTPRIQYLDVPLPSLKMKPTSEKPTFNDLHRIRAKAKQAIDAYYHNLRQAEIRNAWDHWDRLYADVIQPKKLLQNFRVVYSAYSPHREEEAFVVCPWKPGPFRFVSHAQKPPKTHLPKIPPVTIISIPKYSNSKSGTHIKGFHNSPTGGRNSSLIRQVSSFNSAKQIVVTAK